MGLGWARNRDGMGMGWNGKRLGIGMGLGREWNGDEDEMGIGGKWRQG